MTLTVVVIGLGCIRTKETKISLNLHLDERKTMSKKAKYFGMLGVLNVLEKQSGKVIGCGTQGRLH